MLIVSPLVGWVRPIRDTSDAAFAQELLGKGVAIEPLTGELFAPCDGVITNIAPSFHSVVVKTATNHEILVHIGIDTVGLKGRGFAVHVREGDIVKSGDKLISFDLDMVAELAPSLLTPIIVLDTSAIINIECENQFVKVGDPIFEILDFSGQNQKPTKPQSVQGGVAAQKLVLELEHGIHARPAGRIAQLAKQFNAEIAIKFGGQIANANSVVSLMKLNAKLGDEIEIEARGQDANGALQALIELLTSELKHDDSDPSSSTSSDSIKAETSSNEKNPNYLYGVSASNGFAIANAFIFSQADIAFSEKGAGVSEEKAKLAAAVNHVSRSLHESAEGLQGPAKNIALAHIEILQDPELSGFATKFLEDGLSAPAAWQKSSRAQEALLMQAKSARIQERASDLRDLEGQIIRALCGDVAPQSALPEDEIVLIADDLLPSQFLALKHENIKAICTKYGGATAHVGILAASFGIPMVVAFGENLSSIKSGQLVIIDADEGYLVPSPTKSEIKQAHSKIKTNAEVSAKLALSAQTDCVMADGTRIEVFANLASSLEAEKATQMGAEGCGLLRTEFLFMDRNTAPSQAEQAQTLSSIAKALKGKPLIVRTLDIGGDKPISYLPFPHEENPALGVRGIRHSLANIELFKTQIRAILEAVPAQQCRIMLPMIIDIEEFRAARKAIDEVALESGVELPIQVGIMVETPSAALMAENLAKEADFLSVGSNDLTQYSLAMDRGNPELAARADCLHPAVLNLIAIAAKGAKLHGKWIGVCGGIAAIPLAVPILLGLGISELSVPISSIQKIKAKVRELKMADCKAIAQLALLATSASEVRSILKGAENEIV